MRVQTEELARNWVRVGIIGKAVGLKGEVFVISTTDTPEIRFKKDNVFYAENDHSLLKLIVNSVRVQNGRYILSFADHLTRQNAENLQHFEIYAERIVEDNAYYYADLSGLKVMHDGEIIGKVKNVINNSAQDIIEIALNEKYASIYNKNIALVPFVEQIVPTVDIQTKTLEITPPSGLLEL